ncbi:MAG: BspA family leucine-rich repeat surface protein, partial [Clostridiales bacterium]|nr:BspA family leucine-rich repeat surface protein [Clostridiales bacterium]
MKKRIISLVLAVLTALTTVVLLSTTALASGEKFYAVYDTTGGANTLTFYYDTNFQPGNYDLSTCTGATQASNWPYNGIRSEVKAIVIDESVADYTGLTSTAYMFSGMENATGITGAEYLNVSNVTNMAFMFADFGKCNNPFNSVPDVSGWDTSKVTNVTNMFSCYGESSEDLDFSLDLSGWDVTKITAADNMFESVGVNTDAWDVKVPFKTGTKDNTASAWYFGENGTGGYIEPAESKSFTPVHAHDGKSFINEIGSLASLTDLL